MATPGFDEAFYGRSQHRGAWNAITVKGSIVRSRRRYVDAHAPDALVSLRATLGEAARSYLDGETLVSARVPYAPLVELDEAIARVVMAGEIAQMRDFAHEMAAHDLSGGLYRHLLGALGAGLSLRLWASLYQNFWEPGRASATGVAGGVRVTLEGAIYPRYMCRYGFTGYVEQLLEIATARRAHPSIATARSLVEHTCVHDGAPACQWLILPRA